MMMNTSNKHEDDIPGTLAFELAPTTKAVVFCFSTWAGEELECVKCTEGLNVSRPSKRRVYLKVSTVKTTSLPAGFAKPKRQVRFCEQVKTTS